MTGSWGNIVAHRRLQGLIAAALALAPLAGRAQDARIVSLPYKEAEVVRLDGKLGVQATIGFGEGEQIENVAVGDADKWQITPNKRADLLFVKPLDPAARTNMTVVTDRRTYFFDLVASPTAKPVYMLRFTYGGEPAVQPQPETLAIAPAPAASAPASPAPASSAAPPPAAVTMPAPVGEAGSPATADPALLNFAWRKKGATKLTPLRVYDDGVATFLLWGEEQEIPQILLRGPDGAEKPAEFAIRGNTIVVAGTPDVIVLRTGKASATLENKRNAADDAARPTAVAAAAAATPAAPAD